MKTPQRRASDGLLTAGSETLIAEFDAAIAAIAQFGFVTPEVWQRLSDRSRRAFMLYRPSSVIKEPRE